jgi:hypothetical protein
VYELPVAEWSEQIIGVPALVTPEATGVTASRGPTLGSCCVGDAETTGTGCVSAASGGYQLPSDARHQPGASGCSSSGPRGSSLTIAPDIVDVLNKP